METVVRPKYKTFDVGNFPSQDEFDIVEVKQDGWFSRLDIEHGAWKLYSRSSRLIDSGKLDTDTGKSVIYAEYLFGTQWAKDRPELYGKLAVFGAEFLGGNDLRHMSIDTVYDKIGFFLDRYKEDAPDILGKCFRVKQHSICKAEEIWEQYVVGENYEGLVFKNSQACWGQPFGRMKQAATMDYVCLGFEASESDTYEGWGVACIVGGLFVDGKLKKACRVSGINDELRAEFYRNPQKYVGRVFEARGKTVFKTGALRHPNFIRWRDDKSVEDCKWSR